MNRSTCCSSITQKKNCFVCSSAFTYS